MRIYNCRTSIGARTACPRGSGRARRSLSAFPSPCLFSVLLFAFFIYIQFVSDTTQSTRRPLRRAICGSCKASNWIPGDLPALEPTPCAKCSHPVIVPFELRQFELREIIASGGMGTVYLAEDPAIGQQVAIKIVRTDPADFPDLSSATMAAERFKQEARAVASLDHLHILPLYRYGEEETSSGKRVYIIMQYRPEGSLWDWLRRRAGLLSGQSLITASSLPGTLNGSWPLSLEETSDYLQQAASALQYAHEHGIIHRDVKPANFLLRIDNGNTIHLLLSDFGLAKLFSSSSATSHILGTPTYMAPEQFDGVAGPESDQYALAVMIYYFLAGRPPFEGEPMRLMNQHLTAEPPPITRFNAAFPQGIVPVFSRALAKKPQDRYPSTAAFAEAFEQASQGTRVNMQPFFSLPALAQTNRTSQPHIKLINSGRSELVAHGAGQAIIGSIAVVIRIAGH